MVAIYHKACVRFGCKTHRFDKSDMIDRRLSMDDKWTIGEKEKEKK